MIPTEYILIGFAVVIVFLLFLIYTKDSEQSRKIRSIASVVEKLQRELYMLDKKIEQELTILSETMPSEESLHVKQSIKDEVYNMSEVVGEALRDIEHSFESYKSEHEMRLAKLEASMKTLVIPTSVSAMDDDKIIALFNKAIPLETIAKELHISKAEVEFVLKINQLQ